MSPAARYIAGIAASALAGLLAAGTLRAAIVECQPIPDRFTVFLSEPSGSDAVLPDAPARRAFLERLQFELDQNRDARWVRSPGTDVRFVACFNRGPALDGTEFLPALIESLNSRRVVLEIWGRLTAESTGTGPATPSAQMNYLLVPVQLAANRQEPAPAALQRLLYRDTAPAAAPAAAPDYVQLIARPSDIDAFVAAAFGFKLLRERSFELAHSNLCRANALLGEIAQRGLTGRSRDDVAALRQFVLEWAGRAVSEAKADAQYSKTGVLRLQDPASPCAGEDAP